MYSNPKMILFSVIKSSLISILMIVLVGCSDRFLDTGLSWEFFSESSQAVESDSRFRAIDRHIADYPVLKPLPPRHRLGWSHEEVETHMKQLRSDNHQAYDEADNL